MVLFSTFFSIMEMILTIPDDCAVDTYFEITNNCSEKKNPYSKESFTVGESNGNFIRIQPKHVQYEQCLLTFARWT